MLVKIKTLRLLLGLVLAMAFFGCVGLPRRRPPAEGVARNPAPRGQDRPAQSEDGLRIPADPAPAPEPDPEPNRSPAPQPPPDAQGPPPAPAPEVGKTAPPAPARKEDNIAAL